VRKSVKKIRLRLAKL